ncbi:E3 ubiquitin-protein ligase TRIM33-like [Dendronephthya gigantea]|uniref:E3 ubiquitin-protein ligase TRIM33-like n=1 Tax=Dendronephthya gigantea TaxID=151771 RepID=UPI00106A7E6B|nr:E3 ubiquitin-protein ligase TRIM33-like [Dendronephthya gigantea]
MAASLTSSRSIVEIRNLLVCDICKKTISEPKTLSCSHSFCKACVENLTTQNKETKLVCPICKTSITLESVAALPDNAFIRKLLTAVGPNRKKKGAICSFCDNETSLAVCLECEMLLCHSCCAYHDKWPRNRSHVLLTLSEVFHHEEQQKIGAEALRCNGHKDSVSKFYCDTCKELICIKCVMTVHTKPGHAFVPIYEIFCKQQDAVKSKCATINAMLEEGNQALGTVNKSKKTCQGTAKSTKEKHTAQKVKMIKTVIDAINKISEEKIQEVDKVYDPACRSLSTQSKKISNYVEKVEKSLQRTNDVLENSKLEELLTAQKVIDDDIQMLLSEKPSFQVQVTNPQSCKERIRFYKIFEKLAEDDRLQSLTSDTVILKGEKELVKHLLRFLDNRESPLKLCYRASLHGWQSQKFHQLCDGKTGTVVLVKVGNWIFGGYTDQTWQSCSGQYKTSNASFLFSLRNPNNLQPFKCSLINGKNENAICCHPSYGATFGGGHDLNIADNANSNQISYSNLGYTYQPPAGYQYNTPQTQSLFAGSHNFKPTEIEVFY